jgi:isopentenyl diphosphate isomerase/L-lactate dehydrogenase-like FMN-dependent dehydrogenase
MTVKNHDARRQFLRYLMASPVLAATPMFNALAQDSTAVPTLDQMLNVFDFEAVAKQILPPAHWGYLATGVDDDATIAANRAGFAKYQLRVRRMIDITAIDMSVTIFGQKWDSPIVLCPVSSLQAFHPEGEVGAAKAALARKHLQMCSTLSSYSIEKVQEARGGGVWFQLYATDQFDVTTALLKRAHAAACPVVAVTVDLNGGSNRETLARLRRLDKRDCTGCHTTAAGGSPLSVKANLQGIDISKVRSTIPTALTWDSVKRMRDVYPGKLVIKGIVTREDAELAVQHGVDGLIVSNHGGRAEPSGRGTIESLSEVIAGANKKIPVLVDSGFRRGTDIFKALALGATAVGVGRPYVWGLAAYGQPGVEAVLQMLRRELATIMRQAGTRNIAEIMPASIVAAR